MKKVLLGVALVAFMASPAFAAIQNVKVSGDLDSTYINRNHFNLGTKNGAGIETGLSKQSDFITQTRVRIDADLSDNVSTTVGLINERIWDGEGTVATANASNTEVDLYLAYATLREFLYSPLTLTVGRQVFNYGNALIIGDGGPNNGSSGNFIGVANDLTKRTAYDGIKAVLDYKPLTIDVFALRNSATTNTATGSLPALASRDNDDYYGLNANYQLGDAMNTVVEGYFFGRHNGTNITVADKIDSIYVPGLRVSTNPLKGLNTQAEVAWQNGNKLVGAPATSDNQRREAFAYQLMASYSVPMMEKYKPTVNASFTHLSGDKNGNVNSGASAGAKSGEVYTAWDPMLEAQGSGTIYNSLFTLTNMNIVSAGFTVSPLEDVTTNFTWSGLYADRRMIAGVNTLAFAQPDGSAAAVAYNTRKDIGNEYDVNVNYAYTEDVTFGLSLGWFAPGKVFSSANDSAASQALAHVLVNF